jgi:hypothetical protein
MKTKEQIINSRPVFLHNWSETKAFGVVMDFEGVFISPDEYKAKTNFEFWVERKNEAKKALAAHADEKILFATYAEYSCEGSAWVLFVKGKTLYEVNGGHCSCYGLEDQWKPERVSLKELEHRLTKGSFGDDEYGSGSFKKELKKFLSIK